MTPLDILYVGPDSGTSRHRFLAMQRLGHKLRLVNPLQALGGQHGMSWGFKTGYLGLERRIKRRLLAELGEARFDVIWVDNGEWLGRSLAEALKQRTRFMVNHNPDNPFSSRDGWRWRLLLRALPVYDLFVTPRESTRLAALAHGARRAVTVMFTADEVAHRRATLTAEERVAFGSEVAFVGTWMPERGPFVQRLIERKVPLRILGPRWAKAPEYPALAPHVTTYTLLDEHYAKAISGAKIALGLLSLGNQDLHTTRSLEIPAIGTLLCAPRTADHEALYRDGEEAVFFDSPDACADLCLALLADPARRLAIGEAGHARALRNARFNEPFCAEVLATLMAGSPRPAPA